MRHRRTRPAHLVAMSVLVAAFAPAATAAPAPVRASQAVLTTGTSIEWSGVAGFRLHVPADAQLPRYGFRLTVHNATYASVRLRPTSGCPDDRCRPYGFVDYLGRLAPFLQSGHGPGTAHLANFSDDRRLRAGLWEAYLFTDGVARITFDSTGLPAQKRSWRATGRVQGVAKMLPIRCGAGPCDSHSGYAGRVKTGGATHDVGRVGSADMVVFGYDRDEFLLDATKTSTPQSHSTQACAYPSGIGDTSSSRPEDHPFGCDVVSKGSNGYSINPLAPADLALRMLPTVMSGSADANHYGTGPVYLGFQSISAHDVTQPATLAYGVWYSHGIG